MSQLWVSVIYKSAYSALPGVAHVPFYHGVNSISAWGQGERVTSVLLLETKKKREPNDRLASQITMNKVFAQGELLITQCEVFMTGVFVTASGALQHLAGAVEH